MPPLPFPATDCLTTPSRNNRGVTSLPPVDAREYLYPEVVVCALHARFIPCRSCLNDETLGDYFTSDSDIVDLVRRYQNGELPNIAPVHSLALEYGVLLSSDIDHYNASH